MKAGAAGGRAAARVMLLLGGASLLAFAGCGETSQSERLAAMHLPAVDYAPDQARGGQLFAANCAGCHGADARGTAQGPPLVHTTYRPAHHADLAFHWAVRDGVRAHHWRFGDMPEQPQISAEQAADIVAWVRAAQRAGGIE